jgi:hypothetical protein
MRAVPMRIGVSEIFGVFEGSKSEMNVGREGKGALNCKISEEWDEPNVRIHMFSS